MGKPARCWAQRAFTRLQVATGAYLSPACSARAVAWLKRRHPQKTAAEIEAATCGLVLADTAKRWLSSSAPSAPSMGAFCALIVAYGPEFLAATLDHPPGWLSTAARAEQLAALAAQQAALEAAIAKIGEGA